MLQIFRMSAYSIIFLIPLSLLILQLIDLSIEESFAQSYPFIASTRNSYDLDNGKIMQPPNLPSALSILGSSNCPGELAVYVHGVWATDEEAKEQTDRVSLSLNNNGYYIPLIGFSWDSNTVENQNGWNIAKLIANENGPYFADFIKTFKDECPNDNVRIISHSLGSRVTLSAMQSLYDSYPAPIVDDLIRSIHLLGAAIDDEQISLDNLSECTMINTPR